MYRSCIGKPLLTVRRRYCQGKRLSIIPCQKQSPCQRRSSKMREQTREVEVLNYSEPALKTLNPKPYTFNRGGTGYGMKADRFNQLPPCFPDRSHSSLSKLTTHSRRMHITYIYIYTDICIYIYIYREVDIHMYIYIYIYI